MAYLLLNFAGNSDTGSNRVQDFYNKPLKEQFAALTMRYPLLKNIKYEQFIQTCFPTGVPMDYYISMPNFLRNNSSVCEANYFNNIIIRAKRNYLSQHILPDDLEIILIGDVSMRYGEMTV